MRPAGFPFEPLRRQAINNFTIKAPNSDGTDVDRAAIGKTGWEKSITAHKFAFELTDAGAPNQYAIRLVDKKQIAALALVEGFAKPIPPEPLVVLFDQGSRELLPIDGFDDTTPRGRIAIKIMRDTYNDVLAQIAGPANGGERIADNAPRYERRAS
jgi:hypothetical protein